MSFAEKIKKDLVDAMRFPKTNWRPQASCGGIKAAISTRKFGKDSRTRRAGVIQILQTLVKQRKESIEQFTKGNRPNFAEKENQRARHH